LLIFIFETQILLSQRFEAWLRLPWEITDQYIRSGHKDPSEFQPNSLRTITLSEQEGIKAVIGKPKGKDATEVQSYLFNRDKWTLEKAKEWFRQHHREARREHFRYVTPILEKIVNKPLKIRGVALTAGMSRNLNIYLPQELESFASKLVGSPVYVEHVSAFNAVGKVTKARWDPNSKALFYEAEIYDDETAEKIRKGLIQHVSVGADYERIDILDGKVPHDLHNAELSLVAVPGVPQTNIQIMEKLKAKGTKEKAFPLHAVALVNDFKLDGREYITPGEYILGFHRDPYAFLPEHFSTIWLDRENGILALVGRLRNQPESKRIQAILFAKDKMWDEGKIRDWFLLHPHYLIESEAQNSAPIGGSASQQTPSKEHKLRENMSEQNQTKQEEKPKSSPEQASEKRQQDSAPEKQPQPEPQLRERIWTRRYINDLPDAAFAIILPGGEKDEEGRTKPRSLRKFPHHDATGRIDLPHLRNANARVPQSDLTPEQKAEAQRHLDSHKRALGIGQFAGEAQREPFRHEWPVKKVEERDGKQVETLELEEVDFEAAPEPTLDEIIQNVEGILEQTNQTIEALANRVQKIEETFRKAGDGKSLAEELLKPPPSIDPNLVDKREILKLIPPERVVRSWSYGPRLLVNQLRHLLQKSQSSEDRE
jgi:hypothetical protein